MNRLGSLVWSGLIAAGLFCANPAFAQKKSVAVEILDILRANGQISAAQYRDLMIKAQAEDEQVEAVIKGGSDDRKPDPSTLRAYWSSGLRLDSADGNFKLKIGGRTQNDWAIFSTDRTIRDEINGGQSIGDGTEFRRARLYMEGEIYKNTKFKAEYDFAGQDADFKDVYIELTKIPTLGNFTIGHFKEPFSLEELTSSKYITFMERALPNVFAPSRNTGFGLSNAFADDQVTAAVGVFRDVDDSGDGFGPNSNYNVTTRITSLPWYEEDGAQLVHVGFSYSHQFRDNVDIRFRQRPDVHLGPRFVDTGDFLANGIDYFNPEFATVYGPFSLQGEWIWAAVNASDTTDDPSFDGSYIFGSLFLTPGDHRVYKEGAFDRVKPKKNFSWDGSGYGAFEAAFRYSYLHLSDGPIRGGTLSDYTAGLNWYLNPNVRFMLNYVHADQRSIDGQADIVQMRAQVDF